MFFQGERGRFIGFYALAVTNGVGDAFYSHIYFEPQANQRYFQAPFWPYCRWIYCTSSGLEMDLLCEHGDLIFKSISNYLLTFCFSLK